MKSVISLLYFSTLLFLVSGSSLACISPDASRLPFHKPEYVEGHWKIGSSSEKRWGPLRSAKLTVEVEINDMGKKMLWNTL